MVNHHNHLTIFSQITIEVCISSCESRVAKAPAPVVELAPKTTQLSAPARQMMAKRQLCIVKYRSPLLRELEQYILYRCGGGQCNEICAVERNSCRATGDMSASEIGQMGWKIIPELGTVTRATGAASAPLRVWNVQLQVQLQLRFRLLKSYLRHFENMIDANSFD